MTSTSTEGQATAQARHAVEVSGLRIELVSSGVDVVSDIDFALDTGEIVGLVGESGSGKTTVGSALLGYARKGARITAGRVVVGDVDVLGLDPAALTRARGRLVAYVPQDPGAALNPAHRIGIQLREVVTVHEPGVSENELTERITRVLDEVKLPSDDHFLARFPHQLSGGQQQRLALALAFVLRPKAIVLDEPTTGLDVITQAHVLETVRELCRSHGTAALYVTHDLAVVQELADRVIVLYAGRIVESSSAQAMFATPRHPYSRTLLAAIPDVAERRKLALAPGHAPSPGERPTGCSFAPRCAFHQPTCGEQAPELTELEAGHAVRCSRVTELDAPPRIVGEPDSRAEPTANRQPLLEVRGLNVGYGGAAVVRDAGFSVAAGECLAVVGESGSGKTTLSRSLVGLVIPDAGTISLLGESLAPRARERSAQQRRTLQYVFQNPYRSLNPRHTIGQSLQVPVQHFFGATRAEARERVEAALDQVSLPRRLAHASPRDLSGGERQRAAIARALLCEPKVLVCDEITSALDVSVQAAIIRLLDELRAEKDLALVFVTHNLGVVRAVADRVVVLNGGRTTESGTTAEVLDRPQDEYTRSLIANSPRLVLS
ncbi:ABC transporter ATP-binding protein [Streptomyces sp. NPDC091280]|uniref:ABC transporter ATP-binding protein n=1 Tax=Streptomyces sp. NPDC091280 TaxID=3365984 RepID=UPI0038063A08